MVNKEFLGCLVDTERNQLVQDTELRGLSRWRSDLRLHAPKAGSLGLIPGHGTRSRMSQ